MPYTGSAYGPGFTMTYKRSMRLERIARLVLDPAGYTLAQIANIMNCNINTIALMKQTPQFHAKIMELRSGVLSSFDDQLQKNVDNCKNQMRDYLPVALHVIKDAALGKYGNALRFKAAQEILDREGNLAKVSKTSVSVEVVPRMEVDPTVASNLLALLGSAPSTSSFTSPGASADSSPAPLVDDVALRADELLDSVDLKDAKIN